MKQIYLVFVLLLSVAAGSFAQTNILLTNSTADQVLKGNFNPSDYTPSMVIDNPLQIIADLQDRVSTDSLQEYLTILSEFGTRNTGSDTVSDVRGIGAARRWVHRKMEGFSAQAEDRLQVGYLQFDQDICGVGQHKNVLGILPGTDVDNHGVIIVEGHMDSRCSVRCDTACVAEGVEDNGSGTVLVMELARAMSKYTFPNTIVFMITTGEEQGLLGANAFAEYCEQNNIPVRAVYNNDIVGGIICGETSSPPSCPGLNNIDSVGLRLFSAGSLFSSSPSKQLSRFAKLEYDEILKPIAAVPMDLRIQSQEDRSGRGGDHIPFRQRGYAALRFCSANEHGDASNGPDYTDRQHTESDILGVDTDGDQVIDSFFVDFNYLKRNSLINANAVIAAAQNHPTPEDLEVKRNGAEFIITINDLQPPYRVFYRSGNNDFDSIYTLEGSNMGVFPCPEFGVIYVSAATVNEHDIESLFSDEVFVGPAVDVTEPDRYKPFRLMQNRPNPFDEATWIGFQADEVPSYKKASIQVRDVSGRLVSEISVKDIKVGVNEVLYRHGYGHSGTYNYSLVIDGKVMDTRQMIFAN